MKISNVKNELDAILDNLNYQEFIDNDPISIPKRFKIKEDIEIASFLASILAWGQRKTIINNTNKLMGWMGEEPHRFLLEHSNNELKVFEKFVHRTFNGTDCLYFIEVLTDIYKNGSSLEVLFNGQNMRDRITNFHFSFFNYDFAPQRTRKHIANPSKNSSAKRLNMFLRWMVRKDTIDFGIWNSMKPVDLKCPLDVHVQRAAFHFGILKRKQQDWKAVEELSNNLLDLDSTDPIKYDLALFKWSEKRKG